MNDNVREYRRILGTLSRSNSNERMPCTHPDRVLAFYDVIFNQGYSDIRVFTKNLDIINHEHIVGSVAKFLSSPWTSLSILLKEPCQIVGLDESKIYGSLQIGLARGSYSWAGAREFTTADDRVFLFQGKSLGIINFNSMPETGRLINAFNDAFHISKPLKL